MRFFQIYAKQYKQILLLAAPVVMAQIGVVLVQIADNVMVGHLESPLPLAGVSFGGTVFFLIFILLFGAVLALTPLVGKKYVQGDDVAVAAYLQNSLFIFSIASLLGCGLLYAIIPLMYQMGQPIEVVDMAIPYYKWLSWSLIPFMIFACFKQFFEGIGDTKTNMIIIMSSSLLNILLNWIFIYGNLGVEAMGAEGAGVATFLSRLVMPFMAFFAFYVLPKFKPYFSFSRVNYFDWKTVRLILGVGTPIALQMFMEGSAFAITSIMMGWIGTTEIAANQIALAVSNVSFMIILGLGVASTIRISHEYGRNNLEEMRRVSYASFHLVLIYSSMIAALLILLRGTLATAFTSDADVIQLASFLLFFVAAFQISDGVQVVAVGILRGMQDVKCIMFVAFFAYILINLPLGYCLTFVFGLGAGGLWVGFIFGLSIAALFLIIRLGRHFRGMELKRR